MTTNSRKKSGKARRTAKPAEQPDSAARLSRKGLATLLGFHHSTVYEWLAKPGAPRPDAKLRYGVEEASKYLREHINNSPQAGGPQRVTLKDRKLQLEVEEMERRAAEKAGKLVSMAEVSDAVTALFQEMHALLRNLFEHELPPKYAGKTLEERRALNVAALDRFDDAFRAGRTQLTPPPAAPAPAPPPAQP